MREHVGPAPDTSVLLDKVLKSANPNCANIPLIATSTLVNCMKSTARMNEMATDNGEYCECIAIVTAKEFKKKPMPAPAYVQAVKSYASSVCVDPVQRDAVRAPAKAGTQADPLGVKIAP